MKNSLLITVIFIASSLIIFFSIHDKNDTDTLVKTNFFFKDGLFYDRETGEPFSGKCVDTADVIIEFEIIDGRKNGRFVSHYLEGGIEKEGMIINDKNEGTWKYYYPNGQLQMIGNFKNNKADGEWTSYHFNGEISITGNYRDGLQIGYWSYYNTDGNLINTISFIDNEMKEKLLINI